MPLTNKVSLTNLQVGDYVWCKYTALTSGQFGSFSDIATKTDATATPLIPVASSSTPNGYFKFIKVGIDFLDRHILIADRNVQQAISWDNLNTNGASSGSGLPINIDARSDVKFNVRILTGGISSTDKDNEWDKHIVNSTLNGNISAGDNAVWNWSGTLIWASTTINTSEAHRVLRGSSASSTFTGTFTNGIVATQSGFRPVLILESLSAVKFVGSVDKTSIHSDDVILTGTISDDPGKSVKFRIKVNGVQEYPATGYTGLAPAPLTVNYTISNNKFVMGSNQITLDVVNDAGFTSSWSTTVTLTDQLPSITASMTGNTLNATIGDPESDMVKFQVKLNGTKVYPVNTAYTDLAPVPIQYDRIFKSAEIHIGTNNTVDITSLDSYGVSNTVTLNFVGQFSGLMFSDETSTYYSDDMGNILKYLDFGTLTAGQTSLDVKVLLKNTNPFSVKDIILWSEHSISGLTIQLSKTNTPFVAASQLTFSQTVTNNQIIEFYVRLTTDTSAAGGGSFDIKAKSGVV